MSFISMGRLIFAVCILCAAMEQLHSIQRGKNLTARALSSEQSNVFLAIGLQLKRETTPILKHTHPHKSGVSLVKQRVKQRVQ